MCIAARAGSKSTSRRPPSAEDVSLSSPSSSERFIGLLEEPKRGNCAGGGWRGGGGVDDKGYYVCCNIHFPNSDVSISTPSAALLSVRSLWMIHFLVWYSPRRSTPMFIFLSTPPPPCAYSMFSMYRVSGSCEKESKFKKVNVSHVVAGKNK